jgi:hypothetical protein
MEMSQEFLPGLHSFTRGSEAGSPQFELQELDSVRLIFDIKNSERGGR